jgi:hypothetical protein
MKLYVFFWAEASAATDLDWHISCIGMGARAGRLRFSRRLMPSSPGKSVAPLPQVCQVSSTGLTGNALWVRITCDCELSVALLRQPFRLSSVGLTPSPTNNKGD